MRLRSVLQLFVADFLQFSLMCPVRSLQFTNARQITLKLGYRSPDLIAKLTNQEPSTMWHARSVFMYCVRVRIKSLYVNYIPPAEASRGRDLALGFHGHE